MPRHHDLPSTGLPRRLRIGYVSPDFREHCQTLFTTPLLSHHDHGAFEIYCYSSVERPDERTRRLAEFADVWRDVRTLDDVALADAIRADHIDILVDLTMHMAKGRPLTFARRPAPIQVAWLAYPGTTGIDAMDFRISDSRLDPPGFDSHYSERTIRLPDSFWCYDPLTTEPTVNALPALERGYVTLGCLNNPCKLTDATLRLWSRVLHAVPTSRLQLLAPSGRHGRHAAAATANPRHCRGARGTSPLSRPRRLPAFLSRHRLGPGYVSLTTGTPPVSTRCGWECPRSLEWAKPASAAAASASYFNWG
jgi:predicted O-linked N-acetylglucosamine transferase (SPINDLY family)